MTEIICCSFAFITTLSCRIYYIDDIYINTFLRKVSSSWYRNPTCSSHVNYHHQLLNLILLNNSLHHNITQPPVNKMPRVCALIDETSPIPKYFKPRRTRSTTNGHCRAGCGGQDPDGIAFVRRYLEIYWPYDRLHCFVLLAVVWESARHLMLQILLAGGQGPGREKERKDSKKEDSEEASCETDEIQRTCHFRHW